MDLSSSMDPSFNFRNFENYTAEVNCPPKRFQDDAVGNIFSSVEMGGNNLYPYGLFPEISIQQATLVPLTAHLRYSADCLPRDDANFSDFIQLGRVPAYADSYSARPDASELSKNIPQSDKSLEVEDDTFNGGKRTLSTEEVMRVAAAHFVQLSALVSGDSSKLKLPFGLSLSSLTGEDVRNVELASLLMSAAEKLSNQHSDRAKVLLNQCYMLSSKTGNPVQRVVHYSSDALRERIDGSKKTSTAAARQVIKAILTDHPVHLVANNTLPFSQVLHSTAMQAIFDCMAIATRIHMIDLSIKQGQQWTFLMHALATREKCVVESLRISAVGTSYEAIMVIGKRLSSFAESLNLPFEFRAVITPNMDDLREGMFELDEREALGVHASLIMNTLIVKPNSLDNLMKVIQKLNPRILTVIDVEAKLNSRSFINRFAEALFFYSAYFDCLDSLMERDDTNRMVIEGDFFSQAIKSILAAEGSERIIRQVGMKVWRSYFARFGLMEAELSEWSMYQAEILVKQFVKDDSCTLATNGNSLLIGWKGTPIHFVSAWKFQKEDVK